MDLFYTERRALKREIENLKSEADIKDKALEALLVILPFDFLLHAERDYEGGYRNIALKKLCDERRRRIEEKAKELCNKAAEKNLEKGNP